VTTALTARQASHRVWGLFVVGLLISIWMVARSQVGGDQLNLLARGWILADEGRWISYGNPMSTGGKAPGGITSLLVGLPLMVWRDHRAPTVVVLLFNIFAYLLLDATLKRHLTPRERVYLSLLYWLNPWRLYFSAFLWNPNYLFLFGAIHLRTCLDQRERARFWPSFLHAFALLLALQMHASVLLLAAASGLLWLRGYFRVHWPGAILGALLAALPLVPWFLDLRHDPGIITEADKGFLGRGLIFLFPLLRGLLYWLRYSSLSIAGKMLRFDFGDFLGAAQGAHLGKIVSKITEVILPLTLILPLLANRWLWQRFRPRLRRKPGPETPIRVWLQGYAGWTFLAAVVIFALSPTTVMMWQVLVILHAAILPLLLWAGALDRTRLAPRVDRWAKVYVTAEILLLVLLPLGSTHYRCSGHDGSDSFGLALRYDHPMLHELHIQSTCPLPLNRPDGWWPDVLPGTEKVPSS
jgi:hypothetical protein